MLTEAEVYGFHRNANITKNQSETLLLLNGLIKCQGEGGGGGGDSDNALSELCATVLAEWPE